MKKPFDIPDYAQELLSLSVHGIKPLIKRLSDIINMPVFLTDALYQMQLNSESPHFVMEDKIIAIQPLEEFQGNNIKCEITTTEQTLIGMSSPVLYQQNTLGYLFMIAEEKKADLNMYGSLLSYTANLCAIQMQRKIDIRHESYKYKEAFLFDLLYGNLKQNDEIVDQAQIWGWDMKIPHTVIVFSLKEFNHFSTDKLLLTTLFHLIEKYFTQNRSIPMAINRQNQVIVFLPITNVQREREEISDFISTIFEEVGNLPTEQMIACGIGKTYHTPADLFRSFQEAKIAFELGLALKITTPFFSDLGLERILYKHDLQELKEFYYNVLGKLEVYDSENDTRLMNTLEDFVNNQFDITKTSAAIFLHRNTLRYRLKKIEEILSIKLDDLSKRLDITAAFRIKQLRKL